MTRQHQADSPQHTAAGGHWHVMFTMLVLVGSLLWSAPVLARSFGAGLENSHWYLTESIFSCALSHEVPGYGRAVFLHRAGEQLGFYLESDLPLMKPGQGLLVVEAPTWRPGEATRQVGYVKVSDSRKPVEAGHREAVAMVDGLLSGMAPTITRQSRYQSEPVRVRLSNINFSNQFDGYRRCVSGLLPVNFDQIHRSRVPFAPGSSSLSDQDRQLLDKIAIYVAADQTVERLLVDGHSDSSGSRIRNRVLSEERAQAVADYLIQSGVPETMIVVRSHADEFPASRSHAENRRSTIRLERQGDYGDLRQADRGARADKG